MSQLGPLQARTASSVIRVVPSWLIATKRSASRSGRRTRSSACTASPPVWAAWNDVPQPVWSRRSIRKALLGRNLPEPVGLRRPSPLASSRRASGGLYHPARGRLRLRAPRVGALSRPGRHGPRQQRGLHDVHGVRAPRVPEIARAGPQPARGADTRPRRGRLPVADRARPGGRDRRPARPDRAQELRSRARGPGRRNAGGRGQVVSSSPTTTRRRARESFRPSGARSSRECRFERLPAGDPVQRRAAARRADAAGAVGGLLHHVRRRLALRDARYQRDRPLRRAHVLQGHRAAPDRAADRARARRHRRRVQRLHEQGVHGLLRQVRRRAPTSTPSTSWSTCSSTRSSIPRRSSARRA